MVNRNVGLEYKLEDRKRDLAQLKQRIQKINRKLDECVDFEEEEKLKTRKNNIFKDMTAIGNEINEIEAKLQQQDEDSPVNSSHTTSLLSLLDGDNNWLIDIQKAYQTTVAHWPTFAPKEMQSLPPLIVQLERMGRCEAGYSALESFIAHLFEGTEDLQLMVALTQWGKAEGRTYDWPDLYRQIQDEWTEKVKNNKPAILIRIESAQEVETQSDNKPHYRLEAWLLENLETYQSQGKQRTGYRALISAGTPAAEPFTLEALDAKLQPLLKEWLKDTKQLLVNCKNDPEFYVFLPMTLLPLAVDAWPLDTSKTPNLLGHLYTVVMCCSDLFYENVYPTQDWKNYWEKHEASLDLRAGDVFIGGDHQDVKSFLDALEVSEEVDNIVGWKVETSPCACDVEELSEEYKDLFEELVIMGFPLAIWGRCQEADIDNAQELDKLLKGKTLGELPRTVWLKRLRDRRQSPDRYIGHHLSLLRNNPYLIPPSAISYRSA